MAWLLTGLYSHRTARSNGRLCRGMSRTVNRCRALALRYPTLHRIVPPLWLTAGGWPAIGLGAPLLGSAPTTSAHSGMVT